MKAFFQMIFATALALTALASPAQTTITHPSNALLPTMGMWLSDAKPNHGWTFEITPTGFMFVTLFTYGSDGSPTFLTAQGQYTATPGDPAGNMGRFESPLYRSVGGAPFDSTAQSAATAVALPGTAEITFQSGRRATWRYGANTYQLYSFQDYAGIDGGFKLPDGLAGRWMVTHFIDLAAFGGVGTGFGTTYVLFTDAGTVDGKRIFDAVCLDQCLVKTAPDRFLDQGNLPVISARAGALKLRLTYDPITRQLRSESRSATEYKDWNKEILVVSANELQGRPYLGANGMPTDGRTGPIDKRGLRFVRMPDDFRF